MAAAVDRRARLNDDIARAAFRARMLRDLEAADHAPAVQPNVMMAELLGVILRFRHELAGPHHLAGEVVVADERLEFADRAVGARSSGRMQIVTRHREPPSVRSVEPGCGADARIADDRAWIRAVRAVEYCAEPQLRLAQLDAVRCAGDNAVVADHGLHPDTETRLDIGNVIRGMRGRFLREQRQQAATQPIVLAHAGRNEYR